MSVVDEVLEDFEEEKRAKRMRKTTNSSRKSEGSPTQGSSSAQVETKTVSNTPAPQDPSSNREKGGVFDGLPLGTESSSSGSFSSSSAPTLSAPVGSSKPSVLSGLAGLALGGGGEDQDQDQDQDMGLEEGAYDREVDFREARPNWSEFYFDEEKLAVLKEFFPPSLALASLLKSWERNKLLKKVPFFPDGVIPPALRDDISGLSASLSPAEKKTIQILAQCQERGRAKIRILLYNMYKHMDPEVDLGRQNSVFKENHNVFLLELDDFVFYIKEQQRIILARHGLESALGLKDRSIIPPEMKDELKNTVDWKETVPVRIFHPPRGRGSHRGRGGRGSRKGFSRRSSFGGGQGGGYRSGGSDGGSGSNFNRKNSYNHNSYSNNYSNNSFGKGRGRGGSSSRGGYS